MHDGLEHGLSAVREVPHKVALPARCADCEAKAACDSKARISARFASLICGMRLMALGGRGRFGIALVIA